MNTNSKIISITPVNDLFTVSWMLSKRCNYDCMYCPDFLHDATSVSHSLEKLQESWIKIFEKSQHLNLGYKIVFGGGEVTVNKSFLPFVKWMRNNYPSIKQIMITTNGSASCRYYIDLAKYVESISFSTHSEFIKEKDFFNKAVALNKILIRPEKSFHVNIMNEYWNHERIELYKKFLDQHQISYIVNNIEYRLATRTFFIKKGKYDIDQVG